LILGWLVKFATRLSASKKSLKQSAGLNELNDLVNLTDDGVDLYIQKLKDIQKCIESLTVDRYFKSVLDINVE
jgi:hypothetical protein